MESAPPKPPRSSIARLRPPARGPQVSPSKNTGLLLAILLVFGIGIGLSEKGRAFLYNLYSPGLILIVVLLITEYILLKGRDRTRIYKRELDTARAKRQSDLEFLRHIEAELAQVEQGLADAGGDGAPAAAARERTAALRRELGERF